MIRMSGCWENIKECILSEVYQFLNSYNFFILHFPVRYFLCIVIYAKSDNCLMCSEWISVYWKVYASSIFHKCEGHKISYNSLDIDKLFKGDFYTVFGHLIFERPCLSEKCILQSNRNKIFFSFIFHNLFN